MPPFDNLSLSGRHLIEGRWLDSDRTFDGGQGRRVFVGTEDIVEAAGLAAEAAFERFSATSRAARAEFLRAIAEELDALGDAITQAGVAETGLPQARLEGERGRTTGQLRLFASHIESEDYLDLRHDPAMPERTPLPRADLKLMQLPVGPVAVFGASNFPLAFSVAGGDTAAALAAGCPVVVKGHESHTAVGELAALAIHNAIKRCEIPLGVFSFVQGGGHETGANLVQHPAIKAVGFTGSLKGGRALFDLCAARPEPIPFFGELGSVNPVFMLPGVLADKAGSLGAAWAGSLLLGAGQFCTNPGVVLVPEGQDGDAFVESAVVALSQAGAQTMLSQGIANSCARGAQQLQAAKGVECLVEGMVNEREVTPSVVACDWATYSANPELSHEVFGPVGVIVRVKDVNEMEKFLDACVGQLTMTLHLTDRDHDAARKLMPKLVRKAGRVLANGFPTGVEVCDSMVHGGPYPASTNFGATSVGTMAIRRFLRPVCFQDIDPALLPEELC